MNTAVPNVSPSRSRWKAAGAAAAFLSGAVLVVAWLRPSSRLDRALDRLLTAPLTIWRAPPETFDNFGDRESASSMAMVLRSGTNCVPYLCRELRRRETGFTRFYLLRWRSLPPFLARILPQPVAVRSRRLRAITLLQCLGQGAIRPAAGALIDLLSDSSPEIAAQAASALGPLLAESARAREAFVDYFRRAQGGEFLGAEMWGGEFWKELPELLPQLVRQLESPYLAGDAARALENYGPNAASAVPALIEVATDGFSGGYEKLERADGTSFGLILEARCNALPALAKIGVRDERVLETLLQAWQEEGFPLLRYNGGAALAACGETVAPLVPRMVATLEDADGFTLVRKVHTLGELGPMARAALPKLRAYERGEFPTDSPKELTDATAADVQFAATVAICLIAPEEAVARLDRLATALDEREEAARCLGSLKNMVGHIIPLMRRRLTEEDRLVAARAAFVILRLDPDDAGARERLRAECQSRDLIRRLVAARLLCEATQDAAHAMPVFLEMLHRPELRFEAEEGIRACGRGARPAVPQLLDLLWHPRGEIRWAAGGILREIAPETLPPINERAL